MKGKLSFEKSGLKFEIEFENKEESEFALELALKILEALGPMLK